ncbi:hypothetical protein WJX81_000622 [Elliptochloris bilobata]|uniref:AAA+ ATPase domain-containing protein n=1 Tax=Elliptochloris bilobata TaxID=381761 RepID=A0AAW1QW90_9CHLO
MVDLPMLEHDDDDGSPLLTVQLCAAPAPAAPAAELRLWLPPDAMHAARLAAADLVAVGVAAADGEAAGQRLTGPPAPLALWPRLGAFLSGGSGSGGRARRLLELLASRHLSGRALLPGNPVLLPLLGRQCLAVAAAEAIGGGADGPAAEAARRAAAAGAAAAHDGFAALGGLAEQTAALRELVTLPLQAPALFERFGVRPPRGVLLWGPPGTGKTGLARAAAADARARLLVLNGPDVVSEFYGASEAGLLGVFAAARAAAPAVIFIDELDALAPARGGSAADGAGGVGAGASAGGDMAARVVTTLLTALDGLNGTSDDYCNGVVVLAATNRPEAVDAALRRPGRFDRELEVGVPSPAARADILRVTLRRLRHALGNGEVAALAAAAHGFVGADLAALCEEAALVALRRAVAAKRAGKPLSNLQVTAADMRAAQTRVRPSAMREVALELPAVRWDDVGGLAGVKQRLREAVEWPQRHPDALERLGARAPRGVLLYGPPGCSKTLLARAVAAESRLNFLAVKGPELLSKYVGDSEKAVAALFARARAAAPAIVFFDEIDGLAGMRGEGGGGAAAAAGDRVLAQLLTEMDGLQARGGVVVLAATNRPDRLDAALLRPGRFDRALRVPPPDQEGREAILAVHTRRTPLAPDVDLVALAASTPGYTGADLAAVVREAALAALQEDMGARTVAARHFAAALDEPLPSRERRSARHARREWGCLRVRAAPGPGAGTLASSAAGLLLWAAFAAYAILLSPNQTPLRDQYFLQKLVGLGSDSVPVNAVFSQIFNIMGVWPAIYAAILVPSAKSGNKVPAWPFVGLSFGLGVLALGPYFALWTPAADARAPPRRSDMGGWRNLSLRITESRVTAAVLLVATVVTLGQAAVAPSSEWAQYFQLFDESRFVHVTTLDCSALTLFCPFWMWNDAQRRGWGARGTWLPLLSCLPILGPAIYLVARPNAE